MPRIEKPYKKYMVIYMDILGFRERVDKSLKIPKETEDIARILKEADRLARNFTQAFKGLNIKAGVFSDTILVTCERPDVTTAGAAIVVASVYQIALMTRGFFLRGSAVIGGLYLRVKANIAFGPSIIRALNEEKLAVWPRVVTAPDLTSNLDPVSIEHVELALRPLSFESRPTINDAVLREVDQPLREMFDSFYLARSADGLRYINYFKIGFAFLISMRWVSEYNTHEIPDWFNIDLLPLHRDAILEAAKVCEAANDTNILSKYHSLAMYHNEVIDSLRNSLSEQFDPVTATPSTYLAYLYYYGIIWFSGLGINISEDAKKDFLVQKIKGLSQDIAELDKHEIQLRETFPTLYS